MSEFTKLLILALLVPLVALIGATLAADVVSPPAAIPVTAQELFDAFVAMKASTVVTEGVLRNEDPRFYSREWIDEAIRSALEASTQPEASDLNWVADSLSTRLSAGMGIERVYRIELIYTGAGKGSLAMQVTDQCQRPSTLTVAYVYEDGAWRIAHVTSNSTKAGQAWFQSGLKPMKLFAHMHLRDRSRYVNESNLGKALGLDVKNHECDASR